MATRWNQPCTEEHLAQITVWIADWRALSPFLGLTEAEEIAILESTHSVPARKMAMLRKWKQKKGRAATYNQLCRVFRMCELFDLEDKMIQILAETNSSVDEEGRSNCNRHSSSYMSTFTLLFLRFIVCPTSVSLCLGPSTATSWSTHLLCLIPQGAVHVYVPQPHFPTLDTPPTM